MTKHLRILAPLLATAALAAGCGSAGSSNDNATKAATDDYGYSQPAKKTTAKADPATVEMTNTTFSPQNLKVKVGETVTFVNKDEIAHTATAGDGSFDSKTLNAGAKFSFRATKAGKIDYVCSFHPGMTGTIEVTA